MLVLTAIAIPQSSTAQSNSTPAQPAPPVITASSPSQNGLTVPSLWWAAEQFGGNLLETWLAYPKQGKAPGRIDLIVRREVWRPLGYVDRYAFINHFGTVARDYGYNLNVFDQEQNFLATYACNFGQASPQYLEGVRDSQGRSIPDYVPNRSPGGLACRVRLNPLIL